MHKEIEIGFGRTPAVHATSQQLATFARSMLIDRKKRMTAFPGVVFREPLWDMMLDLYVEHVAERRVAISALCLAAGVPQSSALRWIRVMLDAGHFIREPDPEDSRRTIISLSPDFLDAIEIYLRAARQRALAAIK